jgi:hypothetical protein
MNTKQHPENYPPYPQQFAYEEDEIDLLELWNTLWKGRWFTLCVNSRLDPISS